MKSGEIIGADRLIFQDLDDLIKAVRKLGKSEVERFDTSVFNGEYVTGDVSDHYLEQLQLLRSDSAKQSWEDDSGSLLELHTNLSRNRDRNGNRRTVTSFSWNLL